MRKSIKKIVSDKEWLVCFLADSTYDSPWFGIKVSEKTPSDVRTAANANNECREEVWADVLLNGGTLFVYDYEEEKGYEFALADVIKGMNKLMRNYPHHYAAIKDEDYDYFDVDALLQVIVFGEVVYG